MFIEAQARSRTRWRRGCRWSGPGQCPVIVTQACCWGEHHAELAVDSVHPPRVVTGAQPDVSPVARVLRMRPGGTGRLVSVSVDRVAGEADYVAGRDQLPAEPPALVEQGLADAGHLRCRQAQTDRAQREPLRAALPRWGVYAQRHEQAGLQEVPDVLAGAGVDDPTQEIGAAASICESRPRLEARAPPAEWRGRDPQNGCWTSLGGRCTATSACAPWQSLPRSFTATLAEETDRDEQFWRDRMTRSHRLLAERGPVPQGIVSLGPYEQEPSAAEVFGLYVVPEARGTGVSWRLVEAAAALATQQAYLQLYYWVGTDNGRAIGFAQNFGFRSTDYRRPSRGSDLEPGGGDRAWCCRWSPTPHRRPTRLAGSQPAAKAPSAETRPSNCTLRPANMLCRSSRRLDPPDRIRDAHVVRLRHPRAAVDQTQD